jgi:hypothetical protein
MGGLVVGDRIGTGPRAWAILEYCEVIVSLVATFSCWTIWEVFGIQKTIFCETGRDSIYIYTFEKMWQTRVNYFAGQWHLAL